MLARHGRIAGIKVFHAIGRFDDASVTDGLSSGWFFCIDVRHLHHFGLHAHRDEYSHR